MKFVVDTDVLKEMLAIVQSEGDKNLYLVRSMNKLLLGQELPWAKEMKKEKAASKKDLGAYTEEFESFWAAYPSRQGSKQGKAEAFKAWQKMDPFTKKDLLAMCLKALEWQKLTEAWTKDEGKFIPMASTYLNQRRWEDEPVHGEMEKYMNADGVWCFRKKEA